MLDRTDGTKEKEATVISIFAPRKSIASQSLEPSKNEAPAEPEIPMTEEELFLETMRKNKENSDRLRKERNKANQSVLKSYRIKTE